MCVTTALGCYLSIFDQSFENNCQTLFQGENTKSESPGHMYCTNLLKLFNNMGDVLWQWVCTGHANGHGVKKGSSIHVTSTTTCAPPPSFVARRGEWLLGKVFDIYILFAKSGDQYCGRILAGLDPMSANFDALPPHFTKGIEDNDIKEVLKMNFKNIYKIAEEDDRSNLMGILLQCLASIVHHSESLIKVISDIPGSAFMNIPILSHLQLLQKLKTKVTTQPSSVIDSATGIPPHVAQMILTNNLQLHLKEERAARVQMEETLVTTVQNSIENNALSNGHITHSSLQDILMEHQEKFNTKIQHERETVGKKLDHLISIMHHTPDCKTVPIINTQLNVQNNQEGSV